MRNLRKICDVWEAIDDQRISFKMGKYAWGQSYEGVKTAIKYIGLTMITTKEELDIMNIPLDRKGIKNYIRRKIVVSKNGIISKPTSIEHLLSGNSSLKTDEEMQKVYTKIGITLSNSQPKGIATNNNSESRAIDEMDKLIGISDYVYRSHLYENRLYDMAYSMNGNDICSNNFVADQIKSSRVKENGILGFGENLTISKILSILENGSLTCIGKNQDNEVDVVWFFYGIDSINILKKFKITQIFCPTLHLKLKSYNEFTLAMNNPMFRFDIRKSEIECNRLLQKKLEFIKNGPKHLLIFWNEDDSQIPLKNHRIEQHSLNMTRSICNTIGIKVEKIHEDSYGPVDFIVNGYVRVQDKVGSKCFHVRSYGRLPYNPDDIDIFQVSDLKNNIVYAIPMRIIKDNIVNSFFTIDQLMKINIKFGPQWKENHKQFKHDFKTEEGILSYVKACEEASKIPQLSDQSFYTNIINENEDNFGSEKQLEARKLK
jgi:hypothetical protein